MRLTQQQHWGPKRSISERRGPSDGWRVCCAVVVGDVLVRHHQCPKRGLSLYQMLLLLSYIASAANGAQLIHNKIKPFYNKKKKKFERSCKRISARFLSMYSAVRRDTAAFLMDGIASCCSSRYFTLRWWWWECPIIDAFLSSLLSSQSCRTIPPSASAAKWLSCRGYIIVLYSKKRARIFCRKLI